MSNNKVRNPLVTLATVLAIVLGALCITRYFLAGPGADLVCPPKPRYKADFAVTSDIEWLRMVGIDATAEAAMQAEEFGNLVHDWDSDYTLYVGPRYDFQEVLDYLNSWDECGADPGFVEEAEEGSILITDGPGWWGVCTSVDGCKCYADCNNRPCPSDWWWEVSCGDGELISPTPTPEPDESWSGGTPLLGSADIYHDTPTLTSTPTLEPEVYLWHCFDEWGHEVSCDDWASPSLTATPTPTPGTTVISTGIARYMIPMDDRYYAVPACSYWADDLQWLVPCSIPCLPCPQAKLVGIRNSSEALRVIFFDAPLDIASQFTELGRLFHTTSGWFELYVDVRYDFPEVLAYLQSLRSVPQGHATPTPTPTATPELDVDGWIEWLTSQWRFTPDLDDWLLIDWPDSIIITDALSQTIVIQGPATVRFGEGKSR